MKKSLALFFILFNILVGTKAQSFADLGDDFEERDFKLFFRRTTVFPDKDEAYGGFTINGQLAINSADKGGPRVRYENPTLGDFVFVLARLLNGKKLVTNSGMDHAYGSGFLGWLQWHNNVMARDRFLLSAGFSISDYIFGIERKVDNTIVALDPAGYFFAAGPSLMASYCIGSGFWADVYTNYDLAYAKVKYSRANYTPIDGYPKPHFLQFGFDVHHKTGIFGGFRLNTIIDRGSNNVHAKRMDISVGYCF